MGARAAQRHCDANDDANDSVLTLVLHLSGAGVHRIDGHVSHV